VQLRVQLPKTTFTHKAYFDFSSLYRKSRC